MKDLCRLCAKKDGFLKDLLDENNKNILKLLQDFIQIVVCIASNVILLSKSESVFGIRTSSIYFLLLHYLYHFIR